MLSTLDYRDQRIDKILGLCARAEGHPILYQHLEEEVRTFSNWSNLIHLADRHGLGPLLYSHLKLVEVTIPMQDMRTLRGLYLRHRASNEILGKSLCKLLEAFQEQGIASLVLKGAALSHTVYPQPALRPMRDLDILVREKDATHAQSVLLDLGFSMDYGVETGFPSGHHHLPSANRLVDGLSISVEVHHDLFVPTDYCRSVQFEEIVSNEIAFQMDDFTAHTLGHEDMLWHIYRHAIGPHLLATPLRLISIADFVSLVEKYIDEIDWERLQSCHPQLVNVLPMLHWITPWSDEVLKKLNLNPLNPTDFVWKDYQGWPRTRLHGRDLWSFLRDTFFPSEWWVRFCYGVGGKWPWIWYHYIRHPLHVIDGMTHHMVTGLKNWFSQFRQTYITG